jgi:hypothetical protein
MQRLMSRQARYCALLALAAALPCAASADKPAPTPQGFSKPPPGYHDVTIGSGANKSVIRVADSPKPHVNGEAPSSDGRYDPEKLDFSQSSPLSNKSFATSFSSLSKSATAQETKLPRFNTHAFNTSSYNQSDRKYATMAYDESSRGSDDFSKTYKLPPANAGANRVFPIKTSDFQGKTALLAQGPSKTDPFATPNALNDKTFFDPEMVHVRRDPYAAANQLDVKRLTDLPNRPLTIKEVRNLINHDQIPNLADKPEEDGDNDKPLNDPRWAPPTVAPMAPDNSLAIPPADTEKQGDLPAPGEMAQPPPENSEPLPK